MLQILQWLEGKKLIIGQIISLITVYLLSMGYIGKELAVLINGILVVLGVSAQYVGAKIGVGKKCCK